MLILAMFRDLCSGKGMPEFAALVAFWFCFLFGGFLLLSLATKPAADAVDKAKKDLLEQTICGVLIKFSLW
jgi:hypothetical protein